MEQFKITFLSFVLVGLFAESALATEIQWATGCTSFQSPAIISLSYNTNSREITLYRSWPSNHTQQVDIYLAERLNPLFETTSFQSPYNQEKLSVEFGSKKSFRLAEQESQVDYFCAYYSFDTN